MIGEGIGWHPSIAVAELPRSKTRTAIRVPNISKERFLDKALWYFLWKIRVTNKDENCPDMLYECVLPHMADSMLFEAIDATTSGEYQDPQMSG